VAVKSYRPVQKIRALPPKVVLCRRRDVKLEIRTPRRRNPTLRGAAVVHTKNHRCLQTNALIVENQRCKNLSMRIGRKAAYPIEHRPKNEGLYVRGSRAGEAPSLHYDEKPKTRPAPWEYSYMVRAVALRGAKMAQDLVPCQRHLYCGSGCRQAVQIVVPGFMIGVRLLGALHREWRDSPVSISWPGE
jgi:hypothetical protein